MIIIGGIFYLLTGGYRKNPTQNQNQTEQKAVFTGDIKNHEAGLIVALLAKVAKADGRVSELEAELVKHSLTDISSAFVNSHEVREQLKQIFKEEKENFKNTLEISKKYYNLTKLEYQKRLWLMEYLLNLAFIDGEFSEHEVMITEDIANEIRIKKGDFNAMIEKFRNYYASKNTQKAVGIDEACEILGVTKSDDFSIIKKKYRALVKQNHPDILMGQGKSQNIIDEATAKLQKINEAYEVIKEYKD